jgi:hypothetical protein
MMLENEHDHASRYAAVLLALFGYSAVWLALAGDAHQPFSCLPTLQATGS